MAKYEITIDVDNNRSEGKEEIIEQIRKSIGNALINIKEVPTVSDSNHVIYSQSDVPCKLYYSFDGFENMEFSHIERQSTHYADEVIHTPLGDGLLHCSCGELNLASEQEAIEHLKKNLPNINISKKDIESYKIDNQTVLRRGETARGRRSEEVIYRDPATAELITFVSVREDSGTNPADKALERVMDDDEWENADSIYEEDEEIYVVRLSSGGDVLKDLTLNNDISPQHTEEVSHRNTSRDELITFVSVHSSSPDAAVEQATNLTMDPGSWTEAEIVHQENNIYVVRFSNPFEGVDI